MEDSRNTIIHNSNRIISKLQLLSQFFEDELVFKIYVRTQIIQKLFENNDELDIQKLGLFHLQFTETIIELLKKIKKSNEKNVCLIEDEIVLNDELVHKISNSMRVEEDFGTAKKTQTAAVNEALFKLYQNLSDLSADAPFSKTISEFSSQFAKDFFYEVTSLLIDELTDFNVEKAYKNGYGTIEKKLMGLQCKYNFNNVFYCGLKAANDFLEIYKLNRPGKEEYFLFYPVKHLFLSVPFHKIEGIHLSEGISKKGKIIQELSAKNIALQNSISTTKTNISAEVVPLLQEYYDKIAAMDFLDFIDNYDIQANILKTMLNTEGF